MIAIDTFWKVASIAVMFILLKQPIRISTPVLVEIGAITLVHAFAIYTFCHYAKEAFDERRNDLRTGALIK